jgi:predicted small lipoprotein YifL
MKKLIIALFIALLVFTMVGCTKTEVEEPETEVTEPEVEKGTEVEDSASENYDKVYEYMKEKTIDAFSKYYELLDFQISNYEEKIVEDKVEATFLYKVIHKNFDKDPDTVGYIKEAKESGNKNYQQMYDEYLQPQEMNFDLKVVIDKEDEITLYSNVSPNGIEWEETEMTDYIIKN